MPASKRELSPPESESKIRKLDEDGDTIPSKVATILDTDNSPERAAAPRTKKKLSPSPEGNNSRPSSPLSDCSESVSDPPFKKAKLLSTSAFTTISSEEPKSNITLMQTALREPNEASIDLTTTDFFRVKDGNDQALCIIQYSNKAMAEEPLSETNEESVLHPVQTDHSYGRASEMPVTDQEGNILQVFTSTSLVSESQKTPDTASLESNACNVSICETEPGHYMRMHTFESQKIDEVIIDSSSEILDNESIIMSDCKEKVETSSEPQIQKEKENKTLSSEKAQSPDEHVNLNEMKQPLIVTAVQEEVPIASVFAEDVKCHIEEELHEAVIEESCKKITVSDPLLNEKHSGREQSLVVSRILERNTDNSPSTVQRVTKLQKKDHTPQVTCDDSVKLKVSNAFTNTSDCVNDIEQKLHENTAEQKVEMVTSSNECDSQNVISNENSTSKTLEDDDNDRVHDAPQGVMGDSPLEEEKSHIDDATFLNGQLSVEISTVVPEESSSETVEIPSYEIQTDLGEQTVSSSTSQNQKESDCIHDATEPVLYMSQNAGEYAVSLNDETSTGSLAIRDRLCSVQTVNVQGEIQLNTSDEYYKGAEIETFQQEEIVKQQAQTTDYPESCEILHQEAVAENAEKTSTNEQSTYLSSKMDNVTLAAESKNELAAIVPISPAAVETLSPPKVTSALSPQMCSQFQEVREASVLTETDQGECSTVTENHNEGNKGSLIFHIPQPNFLPSIFSVLATNEVNSPSKNVCPDVSEASSETRTAMDHNLQKNGGGEIVVSDDQTNVSSEEIPVLSTFESHKGTNSLTRQAEDVQESFISNAFTEHSEEVVSEYYTTTYVQTITTSEEITIPTCTVELDPNNGQKTATSDSDRSGAHIVNIEEDGTVCADTIAMEVELSEQDAVKEALTKNVAKMNKMPEEMTIVPSVAVTEEADNSVVFFSEVKGDLSDVGKMQLESVVVYNSKDNPLIGETEGEADFIDPNQSEIDANDLTKVPPYMEEQVQASQSNEQTIIGYQQEDVHSIEEANKMLVESDLKKNESQMVYEPISSPESTTDGEVPTLLGNNTVRLLHADITDTSQMIYSVSALTTDKEIFVSDSYAVSEISSVPPESSTAISIQDLEVNGKSPQNDESTTSKNVMDDQAESQSLQTDVLSPVLQNQEISKMDNQQLKHSDEQIEAHATAVEMHSVEHSTAFKQSEQCGGPDMSDSVTSAEDAPNGSLEKTGEKSAVSAASDLVNVSVFTEQVQEATAAEDFGGTEAATVTFATEIHENQEANGTCEEYVILEPVPDTAIHYDIITQAVAASGLSEEIRANTEGMTDVVQQANVVQDVINDENTQETMVVETNLENSEYVEPIDVSHHPTDMMEMIPANSGQDVIQPVDVNMMPPECQILEDIEIGREIVVAEEEQEEDSDISIIEKSQEAATEEVQKTDETLNETSKETDIATSKDNGKGTCMGSTNETEKKTISLETLKRDSADDEKKEPEKPKKQEMNTQARTKARLAALAEQKAAASKRQARREQLNLLALCQEIAEDIATDSMLLKKIEEEKQAAAAAAAAKSEASTNESLHVNSEVEQSGDVVTPTLEGAEVSATEVTPSEDSTITHITHSTANAANAEESKVAAEPPKRRFFTSQVTVPLKAHEKKKLTRYQRLRQVELQREKMSWARVKKLKSDQANQMFSDMDWQASMSFSAYGMDRVTTTSEPVANAFNPPSPGLSSPNKPTSTADKDTPTADELKIEIPKPETSASVTVEMSPTGPAKIATEENPKADNTESTQKEDAKAEPAKPELRKSSRISKLESSKAAPTPTPASTTKGKVTSKKVLPAIPPPMPNGLNNQSLKIEYKPYKPRPKYSPDDFELDDDPIPPPAASRQAKPTHQMRPNVQLIPASKTINSSKPIDSTQPSNQLKSKIPTPAGQISGQAKLVSNSLASPPAAQVLSKGTHATLLSSKLLPAAKILQKSPISAGSVSKVEVASTPSKPAAPTSPQAMPASTASQKETSSSVDQPATSEAPAAVPSDCAANNAKCKVTEDVPVASVLPKEDPIMSNDSQKSDENAEDTPVSQEDKTATSIQLENKTESEEIDTNKASKPYQEQNIETSMSDTSLQKEIKKLKEADRDSTQTIIDAGQKHFGPVACSVCGMLYSAANPEDESQHLLFHNQFISAVKYVGWKKERILSEFPDGKIILVLPDDPKYALKKIEEIREMVDNDLGFQQVESKCPSKTKTFLFISSDKKVAGCLIAEHINEGYRVIEEPAPCGSEGEKVMFERQRAWCCSTTAEPAICGISRIWVVNTMRRQGIASRMLDCLRNNFIYGSNLRKDEIAFSDPTPDGKLFATHYFGTSQFLVYNFVNGAPTTQAKTEKV